MNLARLYSARSDLLCCCCLSTLLLLLLLLLSVSLLCFLPCMSAEQSAAQKRQWCVWEPNGGKQQWAWGAGGRANLPRCWWAVETLQLSLLLILFAWLQLVCLILLTRYSCCIYQCRIIYYFLVKVAIYFPVIPVLRPSAIFYFIFTIWMDVYGYLSNFKNSMSFFFSSLIFFKNVLVSIHINVDSFLLNCIKTVGNFSCLTCSCMF